MNARSRQQLGGIIIAATGAVFTAWNWHTALLAGYFYQKAGMIFPAFFVMGLGLVIFPGYREERTSRGEDITGLKGMRLITPRWWAILAVALAAGGVNYYLLSNFH